MNTMEDLLDLLRKATLGLIDGRKNKDVRYSCLDSVLSAFASLWTQNPSFLFHQRRMEKNFGKSNMSTLFGVAKIPTDKQIGSFLDRINYREFNQIFYDVISYLDSKEKLDLFKVLNNEYYTLAMGESKFFSSNKIHYINYEETDSNNYEYIDSENYEDNYEDTGSKKGHINYVRNVLQAALVSPKTNLVLPLAPQFKEKDDSKTKQNYENIALTSWFDNNLSNLCNIIGDTRLIILTEDIFSGDLLSWQSFLELIDNKNLNYILCCQENSHKEIKKFINSGVIDSFTCYKEVDGFTEPKRHTFSWLNNLLIRNNIGFSQINCFSLTIEDVFKRKVEVSDNSSLKQGKTKRSLTTVYEDVTFTWITNFVIDKSNIVDYSDIGRSRWKIEDNNFKVAKNKRYNVTHQFVVKDKYIINTLLTLNFIAFSFYNALFIVDEYWLLARKKYYNKKFKDYNFYSYLGALLDTSVFQTFSELTLNMCGIKYQPECLSNIMVEEQEK
ncbi:MAG: hypothetical protein LBF58_00285 [Deltaproteobacteria bacterium]|jgi:hypothetical protein|nr:hypothetical protein [Deltaproteobacteria bacterium]